MAYPYTGSKLSNNQTRIALSTQIIILADGLPVGAIQDISFNEGREIYMLNELGTDGHVDSAPKASSNITGSCKRIRFDRMRIAEAFRRGFIHVHSQRIPFDIQVVDKWQGSTDKAVITTIRNVWIKSINHALNAGDFIISETMEWVAETIFSSFSGGGQNVANGGDRGQGFTLADDNYERIADIGTTRGAMDGAGLLYASHPSVSPSETVSSDLFTL